MKRIIVLLFCHIVFAASASALQVDLQFASQETKLIGPSPQASSMTRYADYPVSYCLGQAEVSVPLYEIKSRSLALPISLQYNTSGVRVDEVSGIVGLNWSLNAGGVITRTVVGIPDEASLGWDDSEDIYSQSAPVMTAGICEQMEEIVSGERDSGRDQFSYSFPGGSGTFYLSRTMDGTTVIPTSATELDIRYVDGHFVITDPDGTVWTFAETESTSRQTSIPVSVMGTGEGSPQWADQYASAATAWYLSSAVSMDGTDTVSFTYTTLGTIQTQSLSYARSYSFTYDGNIPPYYYWLGAGWTWATYPVIQNQTGMYQSLRWWTPKVVSRITWAGGRADFAYTTSSIQAPGNIRRSYPSYLSSVVIRTIPVGSTGDGTVERTVSLAMGTTNDQRHLLKTVSVTGRGGGAIESYNLTYVDETTANMTMYAKDLLGYYNGKDSNVSTAFMRLFEDNYTFFEPVADRSYNASAVSALSLKTVTTGAGSKTEFVYEGNAVTLSGASDLFTSMGAGHRIASILTYDLSGGSATLVRRRDFTYGSPRLTVPADAFHRNCFTTLSETFVAPFTPDDPGYGTTPLCRSAVVSFCDQSVLPGAGPESARVVYGTVTERVSGPSGSPSVRTDYSYDVWDVVSTSSGASWYLGYEHDSHDDNLNTPGIPIYHFFQRPPSQVPRQGGSPSVYLTPCRYHWDERERPQLSAPVQVSRYKYVNGTDVLVSRTQNEYATATEGLRVGWRIQDMIAKGDESYMLDTHCGIDFFRDEVRHRRTWHRLVRTTETEWLDDGTARTAEISYIYGKGSRSSMTGVPVYPVSAAQNAIPAMGGVLSPRLTVQVFDNDSTRVFSRYSIYPDELVEANAGIYAWAQSLLAKGYRRPVGEEIIVGGGAMSGPKVVLDPSAASRAGTSVSGRYVTWSSFTPADTGSGVLPEPSRVDVWRKEAFDPDGYQQVGPALEYTRYDHWGNPLEVEQEGQPVRSYLWSYGGLLPVAEMAGCTYTQAKSAIGSGTVSSIASAASGPSSTQLSQIRTGMDSLPSAQYSLYTYDRPFGVSSIEDVSGRKTSYAYDEAGRLASVKDEDGKLMEGYLYELTRGGQSQGQPNRILSLRYTAASATTLPASVASALTTSTLPAVKDVAYLDGLGRSRQQVNVDAALGSRDIVIPVVPDFLDREDARTYLPYPATTSSSTYGSFRTDALNAQQTYYNGLYGTGSKTYGENVYELSSRGRVTETSLPGITERSTLSTKASPSGYLPVLSFDSATQNLSANGYHAEGRFTVNTTAGADGSLTESWTDEFGTPVLERVRIKEEDASTGAPAQWAETCYVKDRRGRVLCVIPPEEFVRLRTQAGLNAATVSSFSAEHCYTYAYDGRDRVVNRHLPDQALETLSYNDADLVTSKERTAADGTGTETFVTDYDVFNRPVKEKYRYGSANTVTLIRYAYDSARDTLKAGTTSLSVPSFSAVSGIATTSDRDTRVKGLKTAELVRILPAGESASAMASDANAQFIARSYHYDKKGNVIQVAEIRPDVAVTARTSSQYGFAGNVLKTRETADLPAAGGGTAVTVQLDESFSYDTRLRPTYHSAKLTSGGTEGSLAVFNHQYDALGRPYVAMRLIANAMDVTTDTFTIQGWLKSSSGPSFEETLFYDAPSRTATNALPGKAGLITEWTSWQKGTTANGAAPLSSTYTYEYDGAGRLVGSSRYSGSSTSPLATLTEKDITYDRSGSLLSLKRYGASSGTAAADSLSFTYTGMKRSGYSYDAHGNVTADPLSGTALAWNVIGLPMSVSDGTDTARRVYAADGTLLAVYSGTTGTEGRVRIGNFDILSSSTGALSLESAAWEGGRLLPGTGNDKILYHITDHLGSVWVVKDGTGAVLQRFDYYPFGSVSRSWASGSNPSQPTLRYRFSGKEIAGQSVDASLVASALAGSPAAAAGTPYLDFGARLYDPRSAAWLSQDPLAEKYYHISPYAYCHNDPLNSIDYNGAWDVKVHLFNDRREYGYGVAIVTDKHGKEVFRFNVRAEGAKGHNRMKTGSDTPLGTYDIPNDTPWISGGSRASYGPYPRLNMVGEAGEIIDSGRSDIRIHGGRQEYRTESGAYKALDTPALLKTHGCIRAYDSDMIQFKTIVDGLQTTDPEETPGHVFVVDDLQKIHVNINGNYVEIKEIYQEPDTPIDWQSLIFQLWNYGNTH